MHAFLIFFFSPLLQISFQHLWKGRRSSIFHPDFFLLFQIDARVCTGKEWEIPWEKKTEEKSISMVQRPTSLLCGRNSCMQTDQGGERGGNGMPGQAMLCSSQSGRTISLPFRPRRFVHSCWHCAGHVHACVHGPCSKQMDSQSFTSTFSLWVMNNMFLFRTGAWRYFFSPEQLSHELKVGFSSDFNAKTENTEHLRSNY